MIARHHGITVLDGGDRTCYVCAPYGFLRCFGNTPMRDFAFADQLLHDARHFFRRHGIIHAVLVIQADAFYSQPFKGTFHGLADCAGAGIGDQRVWSGACRAAETDSEFGRNNDPVPVGRQRFPQQFFVVVGVSGRSVHFRRIKECISHIHGPGKEFRHFLFVCGRSVGMAHSHAAQAYG